MIESPLQGPDASSSTPGAAGGGAPPIREVATDALRYWELRRFVYNPLLALIVLWHFIGARR